MQESVTTANSVHDIFEEWRDHRRCWTCVGKVNSSLILKCLDVFGDRLTNANCTAPHVHSVFLLHTCVVHTCYPSTAHCRVIGSTPMDPTQRLGHQTLI